jgi:lysophospholipase L1-like esterase
MRVIKGMGIILLIGAISFAGWLYYPKYQLEKLKKEQTIAPAEAADGQSSFISYTDYLKNSSKQEIHVAALGDSVVAGVGDPARKGYVGLVSDAISERIGKNVVVNNQGVSGLTSAGLLKQLQTEPDLEELLRNTDIITINIGGNDILKTFRKQNNTAAFQTFADVKADFEANLQEILQHIRSINPNAPIFLLELYNPLNPDDALYKIADSLLPQWNVALYQTAAKYKPLVVVETTHVLNGKHRERLAPDGVHPSVSGYQAITNQFMKQFDALKTEE